MSRPDMVSSPQCVAIFGASLPVFGDRAYLAPDVQFASRTRTNMGNLTRLRWIANLALTSSSVIKNADISIGIINLFNQPYFANGRPEDPQDLLPQGGRTVQFQLAYTL